MFLKKEEDLLLVVGETPYFFSRHPRSSLNEKSNKAETEIKREEEKGRKRKKTSWWPLRLPCSPFVGGGGKPLIFFLGTLGQA